MMMSFNFITSVPIDEFVQQENYKASKVSARLRSRASIKIEDELKRKLQMKNQRLKLERVLRANTEYLQKNKEKYREREQQKLEKVQETLKTFKKAERKKQIETEKKMKEDDKIRMQRI